MVRISIWQLLTVFCCLLGCFPRQAASQPQPFDFPLEGTTPGRVLSYQPVGDALWDQYAQLLLDSVRSSAPDEPSRDWTPIVPPERLLELGAQFAQDPRYWQLLLVEAGRTGSAAHQDIFAAARAAGADNAVLLWQEYRAAAGTADMQTAQAVLDELIERYPAESLPHYERALMRIGADDFAGGVADLQAGNAAASNSLLLPFPVDYVQDRLSTDQELGNDGIAGLIVTQVFSYSLWTSPQQTFVKVKRSTDSLIERARASESLDELEAFHQYLARRCQMRGMTVTDSLSSQTAARKIIRFLLVEQAEQFTPEQREQLYFLDGRWRSVADIAKGKNSGLDYEPYLEERLAELGIGAGSLAQYLLSGDTATRYAKGMATIAELVDQHMLGASEILAQTRNIILADPTHRLDLTLWFVSNAYEADHHRYEAEKLARIRNRMESIASFDWEHVSFPDTADQPAASP